MALVSVLWVVALLTLVGASLTSAVRTEIALAGQRVTELQGRAAAEGAIYLAVQRLLFPNLDTVWPTDGSAFTQTVGETEVRVQVFDEAGRVDLNMAGPELLGGLFRAVEVADEQADAIVDAIMDWRDVDSLRRLNGAEDRDYAAAGLAYGAKDADFESVDELRMVLGMTPEIFAAVRDAVTVHHRHAWVNPAVASRPVLLAIPGIDASAVDAYLEARGAGARRVPAPIGAQSSLVQVRGTTYTIRARAVEQGREVAGIEATIRINRGGQKRPFKVLQWDRIP
ncbi:MAG: type II secretion system protein GspK [Gammaproteobacteria bacterium]